jgi:predicted HicB family RNase H-like nuclease
MTGCGRGTAMASTGVAVFNIRIPRKLHEQLREQAKAHSLSFDGEVLARLMDSTTSTGRSSAPVS